MPLLTAQKRHPHIFFLHIIIIFASKNVQFEDVDVSRNREAAMEMIQKSGQRGVPVLDINGRIVVGFDQATIDTLIRS